MNRAGGPELVEVRGLDGLLVNVSTSSELAENMLVLCSGSWKGSAISLRGEGTIEMLTGSEAPSNQLASFATDAEDLCLCMEGPAPSTSNSAASLTETLSGDADQLAERNEGRKVENLVGNDDWVRTKSGGWSTVVLERWWL